MSNTNTFAVAMFHNRRSHGLPAAVPAAVTAGRRDTTAGLPDSRRPGGPGLGLRRVRVLRRHRRL